MHYADNQNSLFKKYRKLITSLTKHQLFRDFIMDKTFKMPQEKLALLLPNGYIRKSQDKYRMVVSTRACYAAKLYPALETLDLIQMWVSDFDEATRIVAWKMGLIKPIPNILKRFHFDTLATKYPDANPETTTCDGDAEIEANSVSWASIRGGNLGGGSFNVQDSTASGAQLQGELSGGAYNLRRCFFLFDTSAIGTGATVDTGTLAVFSLTTNDQTEVANPANASLVSSAPASNTAIASGDFTSLGTTKFASDITLATWVGSSAYRSFTLNADGEANVSVTGISKFGIRPSNDFSDATAPIARSYGYGYYADQAGTGNDPKLDITYTPAPSVGDFFSIL